jgi:hypothetical protein
MDQFDLDEVMANGGECLYRDADRRLWPAQIIRTDIPKGQDRTVAFLVENGPEEGQTGATTALGYRRGRQILLNPELIDLKTPRLFYYDDGWGCWTPVTDDQMATLLSCLDNSETRGVNFKRVDLTDAELAALPAADTLKAGYFADTVSGIFWEGDERIALLPADEGLT